MANPTHTPATHLRIAATGLVLGPLLFTVADTIRRLIEPAGENPSAADITNAVGQHGGAWLTAGLLDLAAAFLLVVGVTGLISAAQGRGARATTVGAVMVGVGAVASVGHAMAYFFYFAMYSQAGTSGSDVDALYSVGNSYPMLIAIIAMFILGLVFGTIVLFIGLRRARRVPIWSAVAAVAFVVLWNIGGVGAGVLSIVAAMAAFVPAARSLTAVGSDRPLDPAVEVAVGHA